MTTRLLLALLLATIFATSACLFDFERDLGLEPGDVSGRAMRSGAEPAPYARAYVAGGGREQRTRSDGSFLLRGLVPGGFAVELSDDKDGDGWPERATRRTFTVRRERHKDGLLGESDARASFVVLGDVRLEGVVEADGVVLREDGSPVVGARVYALRQATIPAGGGREELTVELSADADTATDVDGRFAFPALPAGELSFVAFASEDGVALASQPTVRNVDAGGKLRGLLLQLGPAPATRRVRVELVPPPGEGELVQVHVVAPGTTPEGLGDGELASGDEGVMDGAPRLELEVPLGAWDVWVETAGGRFGVLRRQIASRPGNLVVTWGLLLLGSDDPCAGLDEHGDAIRDCDHDSLQGLPPLSGPADPLVDVWRGCAPSCAAAFGEAALGASCDVDGEVYDCDDDGDGQADITEGFACYGLGRGADPDGDGLCGHDDPYPQCRENDPAHESCRAGGSLTEFPPPVRPELASGDEDAGPSPDAGVVDGGDGGSTDGGGLADGGGLVDGGVDAGPIDAGPPPFAVNLGYAYVLDGVPFGDGAALLVSSFEPLDLGGCTLGGDEGATEMVALLDPWGVCRWSVTVTVSSGSDAGESDSGYASLSKLVVLASGELLVLGTMQGAVVVRGPGSALPAPPSPDDADLLLFTVDASGAPSRVALGGGGGGGFVALEDAVALEAGGFVVAGSVNGAFTLDIGGAPHSVGDGAGFSDLFLVAFDDALTARWSHDGLGLEGSIRARSVTTTGTGASERVVALVGLEGLADVEEIGDVSAAEGGNTLLLAFPTTGGEAGTLDWHRRIDGMEWGAGSLAPYAPGGVVLAASSSAPVVLDELPGDAGPVTTSPFGYAGFLAAYGADGALLDVRNFPAADVEAGVELEQIDGLPGGDVLLGGDFSYGFDLGERQVRAGEGGEQVVVARLGGASLDEVFLQQTFASGGASFDKLVPLTDGSTLVAGSAIGTVFLGGLRLDAEPEDGESFLWRILPDGTSAEHLLLPFGGLCPVSGACESRSCGRTGWPTAPSGLCVSTCELDNPTCPESSTCRGAGESSLGDCVPDDRCFHDDHCAEGSRCNPYALRCEADCATAGCDAGEACHPDLGVCVSDCRLGAGCDDGEVCAPSAGGYVCQPDCNAFYGCFGLCGADGLCSDGSPDVNGVFGDTWTWTPGTLTWSFQNAANPLGYRRQHAMAPSGDGAVVVGGLDQYGGFYGAFEAFVYQGGTWITRGSSAYSFGFWPAGAAGDPSPGGDFFAYGGDFANGDTFVTLPCCGQDLAEADAGLPSPGRASSAMAYDGEGRVWLFGGKTGSSTYDDLWVFDTTLPFPSFAAVTPQGAGPGARYDHALSYTGFPGELLLSGGRGADGGLLDDTWRLVHDAEAGTTTWTLMTGAGLGPRAGHATAFDGARVVLYGGATSRARPESRDVLIFDDVNDRWVAPRLRAVPPPARTGVRMARSGSELVLFGGERGGAPVVVHDDVYAGSAAGFGTIDWRARTASATPVDGAAYATAPDGALWVFGGRDPLGRLTNQLYVYRAGGVVEGPLTDPESGPSPREGASMAFHPESDELFLFGGRDATGLLGDLWRFDEVSGRFVDVTPPAGSGDRPSPRAFVAMAPSEPDQRIVLFGGEDTSDLIGDQWFITASGTFVHPIVGTTAPSARSEAAVTASDQGIFLFGGFGYDDVGSISILGDLWMWQGEDQGRWTRLVDIHYPPVGGATLSYEPGSSPARLWLIGGNDTNYSYGAIGVYDVGLGYFTPAFGLDVEPPLRSRHAAGFVGDELLLVGGSDELRRLPTGPTN